MTSQSPSTPRANLIRASRRQVLVASTAAGATFLVGRFGRAQSQQHGHPFTLGVASGYPLPDGFVLWTRLAPVPLAPDGFGGLFEAVPVLWEVATDGDMKTVIRRGTTEAVRASAHSVHVEVSGLQPGRPYWYRFTALGEQSQIGRTRTAPAPDDANAALRFAFASCSHWEFGYFSAYRHMAEADLDLVIFLGDYIYEYTVPDAFADRIVRKHDGPTATDLVGFRNRHALYRTDPDLQALHASAPCLVTWDDHEVENDYAERWSQNMNTSPDEFLRRRAQAYQAYYEHMPLRATASPRDGAIHLHERIRFGKLATFTVLDGRQYRSKQPCEVPPSRRGRLVTDACVERLDPKRSLLGAQQEQWLFEGFARSDTAWNLLAQGQLMAQFRQRTAGGDVAHWTEGWDGYPASRERILEAIAATRLRNPVVIGGDIHSFWATDLKADFNNPSSPTVATEFVCTSITSEPPPYEPFFKVLPDNPHIRYFESRHRGYVAVDLNAERMDTKFQIISERRDQNATLSTLKRFVVESGKPGAVPA
jgi:alkaline phosphatase D